MAVDSLVAIWLFSSKLYFCSMQNILEEEDNLTIALLQSYLVQMDRLIVGFMQ